MKKLHVFCGFMVVLSFLFCPVTSWALNDWTVIVFMSNDDDDGAIGDANSRNLNSMAMVGEQPGTKIIVQDDRGPKDSYSGALRLSLEGRTWKTEAKLGEVNSGSPQVLWDCLKWAATKHPAKKYALILNSHGSGVFSWRGTGSVSSSNPGAVNFDPERFVSYDHTDNDCLTVFEVGAVLKAFAERLNNGRKLDLLGLDACLPGGIEVFYQVREGCEVLVASPDTTPIYGFPYRTIAQSLSDVTMSTEKLAEVIVRNCGSTMAGWRTARAQELVGALDNLAIQMLKAMDDTGRKFGLNGLASYGGKDRYWDLPKMLNSIVNGNADFKGASNKQVIIQIAREALESLNSALATSQGSMSVVWPDATEYSKWNAFYKALDFSAASHWDEMLDKWILGR